MAAVAGACEVGEVALDLTGFAYVDRDQLYAEPRRYRLNDGELADPGGHGGIPKHCRPRDIWCDLLEQLQPFRAQAVFELHKAGGVAAWPRQAPDEARSDRIGDDHEYDRRGAAGLQ